MSGAPPIQDTGIPAQPIDGDAPCRKCGYNLRGLLPAGRCPECGTSIGYSLQGDLLRFMDPNWVDTLGRGARFIIYGVMVIIVGFLAMMTLGAATRSLSGPVFAALIPVAGWILMLVGWWLLSSPDPSGLGEDKYGTARKIIRVALICGIIEQVLRQLPLLFVLEIISPRYQLDPATYLLLGLLKLALGLVIGVGIFAELVYLEKLAQRIPDPALASRANFLRYALGTCYAISLLFTAATELASINRAGARVISGSLPGVACFAAIVGLAMLVFGLTYLVLLGRLGAKFKKQAEIARGNWEPNYVDW